MTEGRGVADDVEVRHPRLMIAAACGAVGVVLALALGTTAMIPEMGRDLRATQAELQWIADVFPLVVAALLLPAGTLLDRYGRRLGMVVGLAIATGALLWSASADSPGALIASRVLAGVGCALVFPGTLATISHAVAQDRKLLAIAIWAMAAVIGGMVGVVLCALITEWASWQTAFVVLAAITAVLLALTAWAVPETHSPHEVSLDPVGALLSMVGVGALVFAVTEGPVHGWGGPVTVFGAMGGVTALVAFVLWELRHPRPLLDVRLFLEPRFGAASLALFAMFFADFAMLFLVFQYQVYVLDFSTAKAAIGIVPPVIGLMLAVPFTPWLVRVFGRRKLIALALLTCVAGTELAAWLGGNTGSYWAMVAGTFVLWTGIGLGIVAPTEAILEAVPRAKQGVASAVNDLSRELGAAFGIAVTGSAFNGAYRGEVDVAGVPEAVVDSPGAGVAVAESTGAPELLDLIGQGVMDGWRAAFILASAVLLVCAVFVLWRYPDEEPQTA